jgi:gas vesicle protein
MPHEREESGIGAFLLGSILGAVVGMLIGIWNAPRSGAETRAEIRERGLELRVQAEAAAADARERVEGPSPEALIAEAKAAARRT